MRDLYRRLEDWIQLSLERGYTLPESARKKETLDLHQSVLITPQGRPRVDRGAVFSRGPYEVVRHACGRRLAIGIITTLVTSSVCVPLDLSIRRTRPSVLLSSQSPG